MTNRSNHDDLQITPNMISSPERFKEIQRYILSFVLNNDTNAALHDFSTNRLASAREILTDLRSQVAGQFEANQQKALETLKILEEASKNDRKIQLRHKKAQLEKEIKDLRSKKKSKANTSSKYVHRTPVRMTKYIDEELDSPIRFDMVSSPRSNFLDP